MTLAALLFVGGMLVGYVGNRMYESWCWRRLAMHILPAAPMATTPPTLTELPRPDWTEQP